MICCDLCKKPAAAKGPGKEMFIVCWAWNGSEPGDFCIHFTHSESDGIRYSNHKNGKAICGNCLQKLGIPELLKKEQEEKDKEAGKKAAAATITVKPIRRLGPGQAQLSKGQEQIEFKPGEE